MNPIDQLMQSFGASPSSAIAGLVGLSQTTGTGQSNTAAQFAQALQDIEPAQIAPGASMPGGLDLTVDQAELLASLQITLAPDSVPAQALAGQFAAFSPSAPTDGANRVDATAALAKNGVSALALQAALTQNGAAAAPVMPGMSVQQATQQIPILPQAALEKLGLKLEQLPALPSSEELAEVSKAGAPTSSHILPAEAAQGLFGTAQELLGTAFESAPVLTLTADGSAVQVTLSAVGQPATDVAPVADAFTPPQQGKPAVGIMPAADAAAPSPNVPAQATAPQAAPVDAQPEQLNQPAPIQAPAPAQAEEAEGNGVATLQAQQQVAAAAPKSVADRNLQSTGKTGSTAKDGFDMKVGTAPVNETPKDAVSTKPIEPVSTLPDTQAPAPVREALPPLTPERVSGFLDGASANAVAAGLSGLKGETGFMASMSLLGGKPTPELAHHVGQQLNMHVAKAFKDGQQEFSIRLDPAELGRIRVKLSFLDGGKVHAQVMAERPETLDLMQRDTRGLERALEAAGHKAEGGIQFSLDTNDEQSAGRAFAEAVQQEKMRDDLAARSGLGHGAFAQEPDDLVEEDVPLEAILANVSVETGLDIEV